MLHSVLVSPPSVGGTEAAAGSAGGGAGATAAGSGEAAEAWLKSGSGEGPKLSGESRGLPFLQGATDSEKRVQHLTLEKEALKQCLILTGDLLRHWGPGFSTRAPQVFYFLAAPVLGVWGSCTPGLQQHCPCCLRTWCSLEQRQGALCDLPGLELWTGPGQPH